MRYVDHCYNSYDMLITTPYTALYVNKHRSYVELEIRSMERGICPIALLALRLTLYSLTGSRV